MRDLVIPTLIRKTHAQIMKEAANLRTKVINLLAESDGMSSTEIAEVVGSTSSRVRDCLYLLKNKGAVTSTLVVGYRGAPMVAIYRVSEDDDSDNDKPYRPTSRSYPLNHKRDDLVAALFGPAQHGEQNAK